VERQHEQVLDDAIVWTMNPPAPDTPAISQVAASRTTAAATAPANQRPTAGQGSACHRWSVSCVRRTP
jgi:hypothetical protein